MQIPVQIVHVDSYIKQLLVSCYKEDRRLFPKFLKACTSQQAKKDCLKYWNSIPIRLIKKGYSSVSTVPENNSSDGTAEKRVRKRFHSSEAQDKIKKVSLPLSEKGKKRLNRFFEINGLSKENELYAIQIFSMYNSHEISAYIARLRSEKIQKSQVEVSQTNTARSKKSDVNNIKPHTSENPTKKPNPLTKAQNKISRKSKSVLHSDDFICRMVPWSAVTFKNGSVWIHGWIYDSKLAGRPLLIISKGHLTIPCKESRESFNKIKELFIQRLPNIKAKVKKNGTIVELVSNLDIYNVIKILQEIDEHKDWDCDNSPMLVPSSFNAIRHINNDKVLRALKKKKSNFLNFLVSKQEPHRKVVPCKELLSYEKSRSEEDAFIFSIKSHYSQRELLVLENVNVARATVAFIISKSHYESALRLVFDFIRSNELNKRQRLHYKRFDFTKSGIIDYVCINHSFLYEWMYRFDEL